jgi:hypothetical protein
MDDIRSCEGCTATLDEAIFRLFNWRMLDLHTFGFHILKRLIVPIDILHQSRLRHALTAMEEVDPMG